MREHHGFQRSTVAIGRNVRCASSMRITISLCLALQRNITNQDASRWVLLPHHLPMGSNLFSF